MIRKPHAIAAVAVLALASLAACRREPAAPAPEAATPAPAATTLPAAPASVAPAAAAPAPATPATFDSKAFADTYTAPGTRLQVTADGDYRLSVRAESAGADVETTGTWTVDPDARHVLLDPNSKAEPDQRYEVVSMDELRSVDGSRTLRRSAGM